MGLSETDASWQAADCTRGLRVWCAGCGVRGVSPVFSRITNAKRNMSTIHAIYENGVFRLLAPVELPEQGQVEFEPRIVGTETPQHHRQPVYGILSQTFDTDQPDLAARHDEHQP